MDKKSECIIGIKNYSAIEKESTADSKQYICIINVNFEERKQYENIT